MDSKPPAGSLTKQVMRGSAWSALSTFGERALGFVRTVVLARLLLPDDFGLVGIAITVAGALEAFTTSGLQAAIVQRKDASRSVLDTAWSMMLVRGLFLSAVLAGSASWIGAFYGEPAVATIIQFMALNQILSGASNIGLVLLQKELDFKTRAAFDLTAGVLTTTVSIVAAITLRSYWALVIGELSGGLIRCVLSYRVHPYRPRFCWDRTIASDLFGFGKHILIFRMMDYLLISGDDLFVGKVIGHQELGYYLLAYQLSNLPATLISRTVTGVLFPALSKIQDDTVAVANGFSRTIKIVTFLSIPAGGWTALYAGPLTLIVFGEAWLPMVPAMQVLCVYGTLRSIGYMCGPLFQSIGHPEILRNVGAIQLIVVVLVIWPLTNAYGLPGTAAAITLGVIVWDFLASYFVGRALGASIFLIITAVAGPLLTSSVSLVIAYYIKEYLIADSLFRLGISGVLFLVVYTVSAAVLQRDLLREIRGLIGQMVPGLAR
jgi:O-antigen/teichoic acid export membrane protein